MSSEGQLMTILAVALLALFATMIVLEFVEHDTPIEAAADTHTLERLKRLVPVLERLDGERVRDVVGLASSCHAGYSVTDAPFGTTAHTDDTHRLAQSLSRALSLDSQSGQSSDPKV